MPHASVPEQHARISYRLAHLHSFLQAPMHDRSVPSLPVILTLPELSIEPQKVTIPKLSATTLRRKAPPTLRPLSLHRPTVCAGADFQTSRGNDRASFSISHTDLLRTLPGGRTGRAVVGFGRRYALARITTNLSDRAGAGAVVSGTSVVGYITRADRMDDATGVSGGGIGWRGPASCL